MECLIHEHAIKSNVDSDQEEHIMSRIGTVSLGSWISLALHYALSLRNNQTDRSVEGICKFLGKHLVELH